MPESKQLIVERPTRGIGINVGWRVRQANGSPQDIWFGNTRDAQTFRALYQDLVRQREPFSLSESAERLLAVS